MSKGPVPDGALHDPARAAVACTDGPHLSQEAYDRLQEELAERFRPAAQEISIWIERAREHGDIKENADYDTAKNEQGHNEAGSASSRRSCATTVVVAGPSGDVARRNHRRSEDGG